MVEYTFPLDSVFGSLADPTRRDILDRVAGRELTVSEIAQPYDMSLAAVSKHLKILEKAQLIIKRRRGKEQLVSMRPQALSDASEYLERYIHLWEERLDSLGTYLESTNKEGEQNGTN
jgi:DNA-binding transcriptional ArsR family regulator